jgi:hypothetical protein
MISKGMSKMSTYEAVVVWGGDPKTSAIVKVTVPENRYIFPYVVEKALDYCDGERSKLKMTVANIKRLTCRGCIEDLGNQLGHMEHGGCLANPTPRESQEKEESVSL